jgi:UDP-N-acetylglucosamine 2-epimerase (non-hydrolysing)
MMDTLALFAPDIKQTDETFYFCTLHRAENVDHKEIFTDILDALEIIAHDAKIYLPLHPRTKKMATEFGLMGRLSKIFNLLEPLSYSQTLFYQKNAKLVLTDSGGIQEETSFLGTPCITLRTETERPITVTEGTNIIGGVKKDTILKVYKSQDFKKKIVSIPLWDGKTSERIITILKQVIT